MAAFWREARVEANKKTGLRIGAKITSNFTGDLWNKAVWEE
jgi:hypothetical protein